MKTYHLIGHDGSVRPGKATVDQIAAALKPELESYEDRLATVTLVDGEVVVAALTEPEINALRSEIDGLRRIELLGALDVLLRVRRGVADVEGMHVVVMATIYVERAPYAEDIVRDWAAAQKLTILDKPIPAEGKTWIRTMDVNLGDRSWSPTVVTLQWPSQKIDGVSLVARDAELSAAVITVVP